jgi:hypothetical protein
MSARPCVTRVTLTRDDALRPFPVSVAERRGKGATAWYGGDAIPCAQ